MSDTYVSRTQLRVCVYSDREKAGAAGAAIAADVIRNLIARDGKAGVIFASAVSQEPFLAALRAQPDLDWRRVAAFHLDEYAGMSGDHPASFRRFLRERLLDYLPLGVFHGLTGEAPDLEAECARYAALLHEARPGLAILGIGENGHLAFVNPPVCDFKERRDVLPVPLDEPCRLQQIHDGAFARIEEVPRFALTLSVPFCLRVPRAMAFVNGDRKSAAVAAVLEGPISEQCPASALRWHPDATIFLDAAAAAGLKG
jgi:glucosamine-6-phosphate deaminase